MTEARIYRTSPDRSSTADALSPRIAGHNPALDGLRGLAVLIVIAGHYAGSLAVLGVTGPTVLLARVGWCGVDVFFALSGFLITGILLDTKHRPRFFLNFYARRTLRIAPLYFGAIAVVAVLRACLPGDPIWGDCTGWMTPGSLLWPLLYSENYAILMSGPESVGTLTHYWSLAVEEHFYLVWPLVVWFVSRRTLAWIAAAAMATSIALRTAALCSGADTSWWAGATPLRFDGLAIGALASLAARTPLDAVSLGRLARWATFGCAFALLCIVAITHSLSQFRPALWLVGYPLVAGLAAGAIIAARGPGLLTTVLSAPVLTWLGRYSFGFYVWHPILAQVLLRSRLAIVPQTAGLLPALLAVMFVGLFTLLVVFASYHLWERPFLSLKRYFEPKLRTDRAVHEGLQAQVNGPDPASMPAL